MTTALLEKAVVALTIAAFVHGCSTPDLAPSPPLQTAAPQDITATDAPPPTAPPATATPKTTDATSIPQASRISTQELPTGIYLLASSAPLPSREDTISIQVLSESGEMLGDLLQFDGEGIQEITVSRDLRRFAYVKAQPPGIYSYTTLWVGDLASGQTTMVRDSNRCYGLSWAPEGDALLLVCQVGGQGDTDLALVRGGSDTSEGFESWDQPGPFFFRPQFSPDGLWISYTWSAGGQRRNPRDGIYYAPSACLLNVHSCPAEMRGPLATYYSEALWSPDGAQILYADDPYIRVYSVSSGVTRTYQASGAIIPIAWLPERDPLVRIESVVDGALDSEVYSLELTSGELRPVASECAACTAIQWFQVP